MSGCIVRRVDPAERGDKFLKLAAYLKGLTPCKVAVNHAFIHISTVVTPIFVGIEIPLLTEIPPLKI